MNKWVWIFFLFPVLPATGQPGFNRTYGFEEEEMTGSAFVNVLLDNDTLVLFGTCFPSVTPAGQQGLLFVKMDTLGNVLIQKCYLDPDTPLDEYAAAPNFGMIKTSDGGYALAGSNYSSSNGLLIKLSHEGEIEFYRKYNTPDNALKRRVTKVLETDGGYLLSGTLFFSDLDVFLMKVDRQGNFQWERTYGEQGVVEAPASLIKVGDNHFAIGAGKAKGLDRRPYEASQTWSKSWLIEVDSLGNVINSTESQVNVQTGLGGLKKLADGWLYAGAKFELHNPYEFGTRGTIVRTGENINDVKWEKVVGTTSTWLNGMINIEPTPDGHWVAVGQWVMPGPPPPEFGSDYLGGATFKFSSEGDSLWSRLDTAFWHSECGSTNYFGGVAVLPTGSVIAAGYANSYCFDPSRSYGWVLKISKDGCIEDTLCITTGVETQRLQQNISVFPNPSSGDVTFIIEGITRDAGDLFINVTDLNGRPVWSHRVTGNEVGVKVVWDTDPIPSGLYIYRLVSGDGRYSLGGKVVIQK